ncbi:PsbP-related protein [Methanobacterium sp. MBAC-LM]|uniref:PsbP-related protein n=1 Tax=Methanobacterium sp. MBAC-LM TaxID=3412034 RepID=UPI003C71D0E2
MALISGCISEEQANKNYSGNGVSFNYSESWAETNAQFSNDLKTKSKILVDLADPSDPETGFCIEKHPLMAGKELETNLETVMKSYESSGYHILSKNKSSISGEKAYEILFTVDKGSTHIKQKELWCKHNGSLYTIAFFSTPENYNKSQEAFNIVLKSFKFN